MKKYLAFFSILFVPLLYSCNSSKITSSWKSDSHVMKPYHNIMVWGLFTEKDSSIKKQMEKHLVNDLIGMGYHAFSSMDVYPNYTFKKNQSSEIIQEFKSTGVDAVITIALLNKEKEEQFFPGAITSEPNTMFGNLDKYYSNTFDKVLSPGYYLSSVKYFWECSFFEIDNATMIYTAKTQSFDPVNTEILAHEQGLKIIHDMVQKKIIVKKLPKED